MKTLKLALVAILFSIALPLSFAHAQSAPTDPYAAFYPVISGTSTAADYNFTLAQTPYLYIDLPASSPGSYLTLTSGVNTSSLTNIFYIPINPSSSQMWIPLSQITTAGIWDITGSSIVPGGIGGPTSYGGVTQLAYGSNFHINTAPEPMGTVLFLLGGAIMAIFLVRRKKVLAV